MMKKKILILCFLSLILASCSESAVLEQGFEVQDRVTWVLNGENFSKSGGWTYCATEDNSGNFAIYGTHDPEGEGIVISIDENVAPISKGQSYSFDTNTIGQLIYIDKNNNRWSSQLDGGTAVIKFSVFDDVMGVAVEGRFSGTLISKDDGSTRLIENGFFSVRCLF